MQIIDLEEKYKSLYLVCLEDWSDEIKEAGNHKMHWYEKMKNKGLRVKLALDEKGEVGGMVQYLPIEQSFVEGKDLFFIPCIWVHGHKKGRGNFQKHGMGKALLQAAEDDSKSLRAKGIAAWGLRLPFWMKASWFKKHGYKVADKQDMMSLVWKPFTSDAMPPKWIQRKQIPTFEPNKVTVTGYINGWCPAMNMVFERAKRASTEFKDNVIFREVDTFDRNTLLECGEADAIYINDKQVRNGPPPSYKKIKKLIAKQVKKLS
ncbi:MAG: GNAT family N-acetyltransferase [Bacteroidota bacterium]|nr:GNAT family N-acetyltransferase [Bacteroidota bacterium]